MSRALFLSAAFALLACGNSMQVGDNHFRFETTYPNGMPKTRFYLNRGAMSDTLLLFDNAGKPALALPIQGRMHDSALAYTREADAGKPRRDSASLARGFGDYMHFLGQNYRDLMQTGDFYVWFQIAFWVDEKGAVPHAVCLWNNGCPPEVVKAMIEDMEGWRFDPQAGSQTALVIQKVTLHVIDNTQHTL